jgi:hypothetical protein
MWKYSMVLSTVKLFTLQIGMSLKIKKFMKELDALHQDN